MRILFATDLSEPRSVTRFVEHMAARMEADLLVIHVFSHQPAAVLSPIDPMTGLSGYAPYTIYDPQLEENIAAADEHAFHTFLTDRFTGPVLPALRRGDPASTILLDADEQNVDLVVLGRRHHTRLERLLVGSVARDVIKHATHPTLVVPILGEE